MTVEDIKRASDYLRGTLLAELMENSSSFAEESTQLLKFHGVYQQDDRDHRRGADREYVMMVRASIPGGTLSAEQYLVADEVADWVGDGTLRITSRQGIQWHHVRKGSLRPLIWALNQSLVTSFGACGDVVRNVVACPAPAADSAWRGGAEWADRIARRFRPRSAAYYEIWIDGSPLATAERAMDGEEPIYGATYLPRKFKIGVSAPGDNCVDVFTHDVGLIPVIRASMLEGFAVLVGGGQGRSHNQPETYPRLADPLAFVSPNDVVDVVEAVVTVHRDNGDRKNRRQARLKYLIDSWGLQRFKKTVEDRLGWPLSEPEPVDAASHGDHLGWHHSIRAGWWLGVSVESGRIRDSPEQRLRSALALVVERYRPEVRLTPQQNLLLVGFADRDRDDVDGILEDHGVGAASALPNVVRNAMACVALPTCGLALADAERALPAVIRDVTAVLVELGLEDEDIVIRMTGCPNGCARPYSTEIGLVGHRRGRYDIHLGGARDGGRLNQLWVESVPEDLVADKLRPVFAVFAAERMIGETFGDFTHRMGIERLRDHSGDSR